MSAVEAVHVRRMKEKREEGEEDKCLWLKEACEKDGGRGKREEERGQTREVERVHARRMRGTRGGQMSTVEMVHVRRMEGTNL